MLVEVDDMPAVCHSMDCGFSYIPTVGEIATAEFDAGTSVLKVTGTELPTKVEDMQSLSFA